MKVNKTARNILPTFIGVGAPKTATTFLDQCLKEHPDIFMPVSKEPHYFSYFYDKGLDEYLKFFNGAESYACRGEISTTYFTHQETPKRIRDLLPEIKIILSVRNPAEQVYSLFWQIKRNNFHQTKDNDINISFSDALKKYPDMLLEPARYYTHLKHWLEYFDKSQIHIIFHDDVKSDARAVLTKLYEFLGVSPLVGLEHLKSSNKQILGGVTPRSERIGNIYSAVFVGLNNYIFMPMKKHIGYKNALWLKDKLKIRELLGKVFFKKGYPEIEPEARSFLLEFFESEISGLESLTGRDLSTWKNNN